MLDTYGTGSTLNGQEPYHDVYTGDVSVLFGRLENR